MWGGKCVRAPSWSTQLVLSQLIRHVLQEIFHCHRKSGLFSQIIDGEVNNCPIFFCFFSFVTFNKTFSIMRLSPGVMEHFFYTIGTMSAVTSNNTLKDGLVLWRNTNNFQDVFRCSSPSIISLSAPSLHFSSTASLMARHRFCTSSKLHIFLLFSLLEKYPLYAHVSARLGFSFHLLSFIYERSHGAARLFDLQRLNTPIKRKWNETN